MMLLMREAPSKSCISHQKGLGLPDKPIEGNMMYDWLEYYKATSLYALGCGIFDGVYDGQTAE